MDERTGLKPDVEEERMAKEARELRCRRVAELKERVQQGLYRLPSQVLVEKLLPVSRNDLVLELGSRRKR